MKTFKRIFVFLVAVLATVTLVACGGGEDEIVTNPVITGYSTSYKIDVGDKFDPLEGVQFQDGYDKPSELKISTTFKKDWVNRQGSYSYTITAENSKGGKTVSDEITIVVGSASRAIIQGPSKVTHYIMQDRAFDPFEEFTAYDVNTEEPYEITIEDEGSYRDHVAGEYDYTLIAVDKEGVESRKTVQLFVKEEVEIPESIPQNDKNNPYKINLWHANGQAITNFLKETIKKEFEREMLEEHGVYVTVEIETNGSDYDELRENTVNISKTESISNLIQNYPDHAVEYQSAGLLESILPYAKHPVWGFPEDEPLTDIVYAYRSENQSISLEGDYLSLPFNKSTEVVLYNKDVFDDVLKGQPFPETWQELFALYDDIMKMKDEHFRRINLRYDAAAAEYDVEEAKEKFVPFAYDSVGNAFITLTRQFGGKYLDRDSKRDEITKKLVPVGILSYEKDEGVRTMLEFFGTRRNMLTVPQFWSENYASGPFKEGKTLFNVGSSAGVRHAVPVVNDTKLFNIGIAPLPYDAENPSSRTVIQQGTNISLTKEGTPEERLIAWLFLRKMVSADIQREFSELTGYSPVRNSVYEMDEYKAFLEKADAEVSDTITEEEYEGIMKAMALKAAAAQRDFSFFDLPFVGSSAIRNAVGDAFERVMLLDSGSSANLKDEIEKAIKAAIDVSKRAITGEGEEE